MGETEQLQEDEIQNLEDGAKPSEPFEGEVEIVLDTGEEEPAEEVAPPKRNPVQDMRKRIKAQNREAKELNTENARLRAENDSLRRPAQEQPKPAKVETTDVAPTLESCGYDTDKFTREYTAWNDKQLDRRLDERQGRVDASAAKNAATQQAESAIEAHYDRASELKVGNYEEVEDAAVEALGSQLIQSIQTTVDNSEVLIYWLGMNPRKAAELKVLFDASPGKGTLELGRLSSKLSLRPKGKQPPNPEVPVRGGGGTINATLYGRFEKKLSAAYDEGDLSKIREVRKEAEANGIKLPYNVT